MELTILLSKVFGIYFLVVGIIMIVRKNELRPVIASFVGEPMLRFMMGILLLLGGLFLVVSHNDWSAFPAGIISLMGWLTLVKAFAYLTLSKENMSKWINWVYLEHGYGFWGAILALVIGAYLAGTGFGLI